LNVLAERVISLSAEIIQFVPRPNLNRATVLEEEERKAAEFLDRAPALAADTNHYHAPDKDPA
jgi:hypothetical protein